MKSYILALNLLLCSAVSADMAFAEINTKSMLLQLFNASSVESIKCEGNAKVARLYFKDSSSVSNGCWIAIEGGIQISWLDGDFSIVPYQLFKKPTEANFK